MIVRVLNDSGIAGDTILLEQYADGSVLGAGFYNPSVLINYEQEFTYTTVIGEGHPDSERYINSPVLYDSVFYEGDGELYYHKWGTLYDCNGTVSDFSIYDLKYTGRDFILQELKKVANDAGYGNVTLISNELFSGNKLIYNAPYWTILK